MPVFHFNIRRGGVVFEDREGADLPGLAAAVRRGVDDARLIMRDEREVPATDQWVEKSTTGATRFEPYHSSPSSLMIKSEL